MVKCTLRQYVTDIHSEDIRFIDFSCDYVRENIDEIKSEWRERNGTDRHPGIDKRYVEYCQYLGNFLDQCKCDTKVALKCEKCPEEDHEGFFCRCEGRNIRLAKQLRKDGISGWQKDNKGQAVKACSLND